MSELAQKSRPAGNHPGGGNHRIGWIGAGGRMGFSMVRRLLAAGHQVVVFNRTRAKAQPLAMHGATIVDTVQCLGECTAVFATVANSEDLLNVTTGDEGLLRGKKTPRILIDCSSVSVEASSAVRDFASRQGVAMLAAPVSGNAKAMDAGDATIVVSGPRTAYEFARPYLNALGRTVSYVGEAEQARVIKICHNLMLGVVAQCMAEISVLAESSGIPRSTMLEFINHSVMGSVFTRYKAPAFINLDMTATFTSMLLRKDLDLGLDAAGRRGVPLPLTELTRNMVQRAIDAGHGDADFASLLIEQARSAGIELQPQVAPAKPGVGN